MNPIYIVIPVFLVAFPLFFIGVIFLISRFGWKKLADQFEYPHEFVGEKIRLTSARIGMSNYNNVLTAKVSKEGLYLRPKFIFKLFHPGIVIPWRAMTKPEQNKFLFQKTVSIKVGSERPLKIVFYSHSAEKLVDAYQTYYGNNKTL